MDVFEAMRTKRAVRNFNEEPLPESTVEKILNAGRRSQSSKNSQPWSFIAIQDKDTLQKLSELGTWAGHIANAALAVAIVSPDFTQKFSIAFDLGQAAAFMQLAAWELGIGSCLATIYETEKARQLLGFPEDQQLHVAISFGYPLDTSVLSAAPEKGGRKPFNQVVHWNHW